MGAFEKAWSIFKAGPYARRGSMTGIPDKLTQNRFRTLDAEGNLGFMDARHDDMEPHEVLQLLSQRGMGEGKLIDTRGSVYAPQMMYGFKDGQVNSAMNTKGVNDPNSKYAQSTPSFENKGYGAQETFYGSLPMTYEQFAAYMNDDDDDSDLQPFEKAWSSLLQQEVEDDSMPTWDDETPKMDALLGDRQMESDGNKFYGVTTELNSGDTVEDSRAYDTWAEAEGWVIDSLRNYNPNRGIHSGEMQTHPFSGMRFKDYWSEGDEDYLGTVWEREG